MRRTLALFTACAAGTAALATPAAAERRAPGPERGPSHGPTRFFERVATYDVAGEVAEIVAATADGRTLVYTDSEQEEVGLVDLTDPARPTAAGEVAVGGEPTSVAIRGGRALVAVAGPDDLAVVDLATGTVETRVPLGGQPDSVALDPRGRWAAVGVENERDEDVDDGAMPQAPPGFLAVIDLAGPPAGWTADAVALNELDGMRFPTDPEPEFVDVNGEGVAAVTLQENNAVALVDLARTRVVDSWSAGTVMHPADLTDDGEVDFSQTLTGSRREPDGIVWTPDGNLATANEGDYDLDVDVVGGRGFTVFRPDGKVLYDSGASFEIEGALRGHYDDSRSDDRGVEPEGVAATVYGRRPFLFVGSERGDYVGVYRLDAERRPHFVQLLTTGDGPEGLLTLPRRDLFVVTGEDDGTITVYEGRTTGDPAASVDVAGKNLDHQFSALSGLAAAPRGKLYAVPDNAVAPSRVYTLDPSREPALVTASRRLTRDGEPAAYDLEGVAPRTGGGWWVVSEAPAGEENLLVSVCPDGSVNEEIGLPAAARVGQTGSGFEGVAESADGRFVYVAVQNAWGGDVVAGQRSAKIGRYDVESGSWTFARYPLKSPPAGVAIGLSELSPVGGSAFALIERDNQADDEATVKRLYTVDFSGVEFAPAGGELPILAKTLARDLVAGPGGYRHEKAEGLVRATDGTWWLASDNDGGGETDLRSYRALAG